MMIKDLLTPIFEQKKTYAEMIEFCCDNMILFNQVNELERKDFYFDIYCGNFYSEDGRTVDIYQYYIISSTDAERLADYTNEIVFYCEELELYILCVTHWGAPWNGVSANWKSKEELNRLG